MKKIKVFWNGKRLRDMYPHASWFQVMKWKMAIFVRKLVIGSFVLGLMVSAFQIGSHFFGQTVYAVQEKVVTVDNLSEKIEELKTEVVNKLLACESAGHSDEYGLVTFDPDRSGKTANIASYGLLQFKKPTVIHYYKELYGKDLTGKEAIFIALDIDKAKQLAQDVIFKIQGGIWNWKNCADKLNLGEEITLIRKLEK